MNLKKTFSSRQSVFIIAIIAIVGLIGFLITQSQITNLKTETIKSEIELKHNIERLLFDLKATLESGLDKETKTSEALSILNSIRSALDQEYIYLRIGAQQKSNVIYGRLDEIENAIKEDFGRAISLVDNLIDDLQNSDDLSSFGENDNSDDTDNNSGDEDRDYNPNYSDDGSDDSEDDNNSDNSNTDSNDNQDPTDNPDETVDEFPPEDDTEDSPEYHSGFMPKVDRDRSGEQEDSEIVGLKVGD